MAGKEEKKKTGKEGLDEELEELLKKSGFRSDKLDEILMMVDMGLAIGGEVAEKVKPRIVKAIKILLESGLDIRKDLGPELEQLSIIKAKRHFSYYKNLIKAGFKKGEAFKLLLAEIRPISFNEQLGNAVKMAALVPKK